MMMISLAAAAIRFVVPVILPRCSAASVSLRVVVADKPGVMSEVTQVLSKAGISIEAIIQKEPQRGDTQVSIVLITNVVQEKTVNAAIHAIEAKDFVAMPVVKLRVETLGT